MKIGRINIMRFYVIRPSAFISVHASLFCDKSIANY